MSLLSLPSDVIDALTSWIASRTDDPMPNLCALMASSKQFSVPDAAWRMATGRLLGTTLSPHVHWHELVGLDELSRIECMRLLRRRHHTATVGQLVHLLDAVVRDATSEVVQLVRDVPRSVVQTAWPTSDSKVAWYDQSYMFRIGERYGVVVTKVPDDAADAFASMEDFAYVGVNQDPVHSVALREFVHLVCHSESFHSSTVATKPLAVQRLLRVA